MTKYIKREDAIKAVAEYTKDCFGTFEDAILNAEDVVLDSVPSADVIEHKRGHWIVRGDYVVCSECGLHEMFEYGSMSCAVAGERFACFCPCCGADMRDDK